MKNNHNFIWRAIQSKDIPFVRTLLSEQKMAFFEHASIENLETDTQIAITPTGKIVAIGFILVFQSDEDGVTGLAEGTVHPSYRRQGLGNHLFSWQIAHITQKAKQFAVKESYTLRTNCTPENAGANRLFEEHGMVRLVTQCQMRFNLSSNLPSKKLPDDVTITTYTPEKDEEMWQVFEQAFAGHWIGKLSLNQWRDRFISTQKFRPKLTNLAMVNNRIVGFYLTEVFEKQPTQAWLEIIGVLPELRGKGLGTGLTAHALHAFQKAGFESCLLDVDNENITKAKQMYIKLGFIEDKSTRHFSKILEL